MGLNSKILRQRAVLWERKGSDKFGDETYEPPVLIKCRWVDVRTYGFDSEGKSVMFNSEIFCDREIKPGSMLRLGTIEELEGPTPPQDSYRVLRYERLPNFKNSEIFHIVNL